MKAPVARKSPPSEWKDLMPRQPKDTDRGMESDPGDLTEDRNVRSGWLPPRNVEALAKGGKVKRVAGKPIGKEDGLIAVQKGEYVIRKAAVQKHGAKKMAAVNRGTAKITVPKRGKR